MSVLEDHISNIEEKIGSLKFDQEILKNNVNNSNSNDLNKVDTIINDISKSLNEELPKLSKELTNLKNNINNSKNNKNIEGFQNNYNYKLTSLDRMMERLNLNANKIKLKLRGNEHFTNIVKNNYNNLSLENDFLKQVIPRNIESFVSETKIPKNEKSELMKAGDTLFGISEHSTFHKTVNNNSRNNIDDKININDEYKIKAFNQYHDHFTVN